MLLYFYVLTHLPTAFTKKQKISKAKKIIKQKQICKKSRIIPFLSDNEKKREKRTIEHVVSVVFAREDCGGNFQTSELMNKHKRRIFTTFYEVYLEDFYDLSTKEGRGREGGVSAPSLAMLDCAFALKYLRLFLQLR